MRLFLRNYFNVPKGSPLRVFCYFATECVFINQKRSPLLHFSALCDIFWKNFFFRKIQVFFPKKLFCAFWALDIAPTWDVPVLLEILGTDLIIKADEHYWFWNVMLGIIVNWVFLDAWLCAAVSTRSTPNWVAVKWSPKPWMPLSAASWDSSLRMPLKRRTWRFSCSKGTHAASISPLAQNTAAFLKHASI